jgi:hypothetical protein
MFLFSVPICGRLPHLLSVFGNDSDVGRITVAVHENAAFSLTFPDGETKEVTLGEHASCYKGAVTLPGRKHPVRHLLAVSQELHANGSAGRTIVLRYRCEKAWATLVSFLWLPADPTWADYILGIVEGKKRIEEIDGKSLWRELQTCQSRSERSDGGLYARYGFLVVRHEALT